MASVKKVKLNDLLVNSENYRFESVASQKEAIDKMVADQGDKLFNLAEHIVANGLNPNDIIQVISSSHDTKKFIVLEGNRRTVALKLLNAPDIIESEYVGLKRKFRKLHEENKTKLIKEVECTVYATHSEADKWIKLKHAGQSDGVGTVAWNAQQVQRFEEKVENKSSVALQTIKILEKSSLVSADVKSKLRTLKVTNFDRLISDPAVRDFLGIEINNGVIQSDVEEGEVIKGLAQIAKDLLSPQFKVATIYTKEDRKDYVSKFPKSSIPNVKKKAAKPWQSSSSTIVSSSTGNKKPKPNPKDRNALIPKTCLLLINVPKVNSIYHELKKLKVHDFPHVVAVTLRVFIENSMDCFLDSNKVIVQGGKPLTKDSPLYQKITEVSNHLEKNSLADKYICKGIRSAVNNKNDFLGTETLNAYVHNHKFSPISTNLVITWDNVQPFIEIVWANIK